MAPDSLEVDDTAADLSPKNTSVDNTIFDIEENSPVKKQDGNGIIPSLTPDSSPKPASIQTSTPKREAENRLSINTCTSKDEKGDHEVSEFPRRKISDIIKQLGLQDTTTVSWNRSPSPKYRTSTDEAVHELRTELQEKEIKSSPKPVPLPRMSKMLQGTAPQTSERDAYHENEKDKPIVHALLFNGNARDYKDDNTENVTSGEELGQSCESDFDEKCLEPDGTAEETFKVVFVGDAGVGKSSFALRISKGVFISQMSSTLGVDFLMRTLRVDGRNFAVQLWDTAGQERFRSITKSYFRKADGVLLLYDCTCEQSFLNVRQWVEDVDSVSSNKIPLMIVANKVDLRPMALKTGQRCVSTEEGEKLAKDCDTTFIEASAKDGSNVLQALARLIRMMSGHRDLQMTASTMQLCTEMPKKKGNCCGK